MEAIIDFLKNGIAIIFYTVVFIVGGLILYGTLKGLVKGIIKKIFKGRD